MQMRRMLCSISVHVVVCHDDETDAALLLLDWQTGSTFPSHRSLMSQTAWGTHDLAPNATDCDRIEQNITIFRR